MSFIIFGLDLERNWFMASTVVIYLSFDICESQDKEKQI